MRSAAHNLLNAAAILGILTTIAHISTAQNTDNPADDFTTSGAYEIAYCHANSPSSHTDPTQAAHLHAFLPTVWSHLQDLLHDIVQGTSSHHGYRAFFKTNRHLEAVRRVFQDIADGPDILTGMWNSDTRSFIGPTHWTVPTLVCANPGEPDTLLGQKTCIASEPQEHGIVRVAGVAKHSGIVYLCPVFFSLPRIARKSACPFVHPAGNRFAGNGADLVRTQYAILVHELVHVYNAGASEEVVEEVYDIQETVGLNASASFVNAQNFAFYAAGEFLHFTWLSPAFLWDAVGEKCDDMI